MPDRKNEILYSINQFDNALERLDDALVEKESDLKADATIQRFEFTFELAWKALKRVLLFEGHVCKSPRECLKMGFQIGLIIKENDWLDMLDDRNAMSHVYSEEEALKIYTRIPGYSKIMQNLLQEIKSRYE